MVTELHYLHQAAYDILYKIVILNLQIQKNRRRSQKFISAKQLYDMSYYALITINTYIYIYKSSTSERDVYEKT